MAMETTRVRKSVMILLLYLTLSAISLTQCDADRSMRVLRGLKDKRNSTKNKNPKKMKTVKNLVENPTVFSSNVEPYSLSSPFSLPPYESLAPIPLPENSPPFCVFPPPGTPPSTTIPTPTGFQPTTPSPPDFYTSPVIPTQNPPPNPLIITPGPPTITPGSPEPVLNPPIIIPSPPDTSMGPPYFEPSPPYFEPTPPYFEPTPPFIIPSPTGGIIPGPPSTVPSPTEGSVPGPGVFQPPVVYPPPSVPPPPNYAPRITLWCVAKPSVPDPIIQEAMNYACWSGADCTSIQPNGPCYEPNTVYAHASYAFNSYWQRTKGAGGNCEFGGTAMLVAVDPSFDGCHFIYN
ncbi:extensin [Vigna umbellata]|uniref:extensin n=1 Tax=Vigna umbellata TaxID=87088 RepID=UPI001F5E70B8|nr:extensin [Vigna umbellata]